MSGPFTDPLAGLPRPGGSPAGVTATAAAHRAAGEQLGAQAHAVGGLLQSLVGSGWSGPASSSALGYALLLTTSLARAGDAARQMSQALSGYASALEAAQSRWDHAARLGQAALDEEVSHRASAERSAGELETQAAAGDAVAAHLAAQIRSAAMDYTSPLRARAVAEAGAAQLDAQTAARAAAAVVRAATTAITPHAAPAATSQHSSEHSEDRPWYAAAWHQVAGFGEGLWHGVSDPVVMAFGLVNPFGDPVKHWEELGQGIWQGVTHPAEFGKALIDWQDLSQGEYGRWVGELLPSVVAAVASGGAGASVRGVEGMTALERAGVTVADVDKLSEADAVKVIMRSGRPTPGMISPDGAPLRGADLSFDGGAAAAQSRYEDAFTDMQRIETDAGHTYVNAHDPAKSLLEKPGRSLFWGSTPHDSLKVLDEADYRATWAVPPEFQADLSETTVVRVPDGQPVVYFEGGTAPQPDFGPQWVGGAQQTLNPMVSSDHAIWTGPSPWVKVPDLGYAARGAATFAGTGLGVRALDAAAGCATVGP